VQLGAWYCSRVDATGRDFDDNFCTRCRETLVPAAQAGPGYTAVDVSLEFEMVLSKRAAINGRRNLF
jgi:hypothetical protein